MPEPRIFTVREAEATLPLVRRIVADALTAHVRWKAMVARFEVLAAPLTPATGESPEVEAARQAANREAERINGYLEELLEIGCIFKGFDAGLVDFYALREDRLVFLCWNNGEDHIGHWHEVDTGFGGRQPLDPIMLAETTAG